jgi:hypothetical protein
MQACRTYAKQLKVSVQGWGRRTANDLRLTLFLSGNCTENTHLLHEEAITLEKRSDKREMDPNGDIEAFCYFYDHLVPCVVGCYYIGLIQ